MRVHCRRPTQWVGLLILGVVCLIGRPTSARSGDLAETLDQLINSEMPSSYRTAVVPEGLLVRLAQGVDVHTREYDQCCAVGIAESRGLGFEPVTCKAIGPARCFILRAP